MSDDDYDYGDYYDNDDGVEDNASEDAWRDECSDAYYNAKSVLATDFAACEEGMKKTLEKDEEKGEWSFRALKMLARLYQTHGKYTEMLTALENMIVFEFSDKGPSQTEKCIRKFIDRCGRLPDERLRDVYKKVLSLMARSRLDTIWFLCQRGTVELDLHLRRLQQQNNNNNNNNNSANDNNNDNNTASEAPTAEELAEAKQILQELEKWEKIGDIRLYELFTLWIEYYKCVGDLVHQVEYCHKANGLSVLAPSRQMAVVEECNGRIIMKQGDTVAAMRHFQEAFLKFEECGDARCVTALEECLLAFLTYPEGNSINPIVREKAQGMSRIPVVRVLVDIIEAVSKRDVDLFNDIMSDTASRTAIYNDPLVVPHLDAIIVRFRLCTMAQLCKGYSTVRIGFLAAELKMSVEETEELCLRAISEGHIHASLNQPKGLLVFRSEPRINKQRDNATKEWSRRFDNNINAIFVRLIPTNTH